MKHLVTVFESTEKKVTVTTGKPIEVPLPQQKKQPTTPQVNASRGPTYSDAFAQFLQSSSKPKANEVVKKGERLPIRKEPQPKSVKQNKPPAQRSPKNPQKNVPNESNNLANLHQQMLIHQQQQLQQQSSANVNNYVVDQNQRVKTERIPQNLQSQMYAVQENTVVAQNGEQQKLYYTILDSSAPTLNDTWKMNGQQYYGQQQHTF